MNVEIISIGDELLIGTTVNTNASWMGEKLSLLGFKIQKVTTISDSKQAIENALKSAIAENSLVLITGGLGPTNDDITKHVLCDFFNTELVFNESAYNAIEKFLLTRNGEMNDNNKSQAFLPKDSMCVPNTCGTASGMWFTKNNCHIISMPGVPFEMKKMMEDFILPKLQEIFLLPVIIHRHILHTGIAEAKLAEIIAEWENNLPQQIKLAYLPSPGIVKLRLTCVADTIKQAKDLIEKSEKELITISGEYIYGYDNDLLEQLIGNDLQNKKYSLSTAESCSGGSIAKSIVSIPGSSAYYKGGIIAYDNSIKTQELIIPANTIETYGAVSKEVVELMAQSCKHKFKTDYAIATSGIAGPDGGTPDKPVGTVWIAVATPTHVISEKYNLGDNRERIISRTTIAALRLLQKNI